MTNVQCRELRQPSAFGPKAVTGALPTVLGLPVKIVDTLLLWQERATQRRHLASLDQRMLRDMGLSRADVERESSIPFWRQS